MRKIIVIPLIFMLILQTSCLRLGNNSQKTLESYSHAFIGGFNTDISVIGYSPNQQEFDALVAYIKRRMTELNELFDIYNDYEGINNIKTINDNAGISSVVVDEAIIELLELSVEWYEKSFGTVNVALGPVLSIWHEFRSGYDSGEIKSGLPELDVLEAANGLCDISKIIIDREASTVFLAEAGMSLDVGAVAKGFAVQRIVDEIAKAGFSVMDFVIDAGGNVAVKGSPQDGVRSKWGIGIDDPLSDEEDKWFDALFVNDCSIVTSGDYQRFFVYEDKIMGHIISPFTLMPAANFRSVTIITEDSAVGDILSTALFILSYEEGLRLLEGLEAEAVWFFADGTVKATDGAKALMMKLGGASNK